MFQTIAKASCLAGALMGAAALSQYPAFTQQYIQRLGGTVDGLAEVVRDFDTSALAAGLTRSEALAELTGTAFLEARATDMRGTFARHVILSDQLNRLRNATPLERIILAPTLRDPETLKAAWSDFTPAMPLSAAGATTGALGFLAGWGAFAAILALFKTPFRRTRPKPLQTRIDPPIMRPVAPPPRLQGETRTR